jgi:CubicO group peptidase (beta-lactamase class C family)
MHVVHGWLDPGERAVRTRPDTRFDLASLTKLFTTSAFLGLVSDGQVRLDDPAVKAVPEFGAGGARPIDGGQEPLSRRLLPTPPDRQGWRVEPSDVTFRQLLSHSGGLAPWRSIFRETGPVPQPPGRSDPVPVERRQRAGLAAICGYPFVDRPGRAIHYSDLGFMLLGEAVSRLDGVSLAESIGRRVTGPLALDTICYRPIDAGVPREGIAPTSTDADWRLRRCWGEVEDENAAGLGGVAGHAGLFGRAVDVARLGQAWLDRDPRLGIDRALLDEALREQASGGPVRRGLGWQLHPGRGAGEDEYLEAMGPASFGHTGFTGTSLAIDPERHLVVALLTNRVYAGRAHAGIEGLRAALHDLLVGAP